MIHFESGTKVSTSLTSNIGYQDQADTDLSWLTAPHGSTSRKRARFTIGSAAGIPAPSTSSVMTLNLPFGAHVIGLRVMKNAKGSSTATDWSFAIKDNASTVIHTFAAGSDGIAGGTQWQTGFEAAVILSPAWQCTTGNNRVLTCTLTGSSTDNDTAGLIEVEYIG